MAHSRNDEHNFQEMFFMAVIILFFSFSFTSFLLTRNADMMVGAGVAILVHEVEIAY